MTEYPLYRRLGRPPVPIWTGAEKRPPPRFDPRTVQSVAYRYTDYAIPSHKKSWYGALLSYCALHEKSKLKPRHFTYFENIFWLPATWKTESQYNRNVSNIYVNTLNMRLQEHNVYRQVVLTALIPIVQHGQLFPSVCILVAGLYIRTAVDISFPVTRINNHHTSSRKQW